ncbi:MAG: GNAT family N-acetyltransferase [Deinococcota bacterium]
MQPTTAPTITRAATPNDAPLVCELYKRAPDYFERLGAEVPTLSEVSRELEVALADPCRRVELILSAHEGLLDSSQNLANQNPANKQNANYVSALTKPVQLPRVVGYLDYKMNFPERGDTTINLLLVGKPWQRSGYGARAMEDLEARLSGRVKRLLASIYGQNPRAKRFWEALGYSFAIDAKPVLDWYAKYLEPQPSTSLSLMRLPAC